MRVKPPPDHIQPNLFDVLPDKEYETAGSSRTHTGAIVEEVLASILDLTPIQNSGEYDIVYDAHGHGTYVEAKSVNWRSAIPLYEWRRKKDRHSGVPLVYAVGLHRLHGCAGIRETYSELSRTLDTVLVLPFHVLDRLAPKFRKRQLVKGNPDSRAGYERKGYCDGYRNVPVKRLVNLRYKPPVKVEAWVYGVEFCADVRVHVGAGEGWLEFARSCKSELSS